MGITRGELQLLGYREEATFGTRQDNAFVTLPYNTESLTPTRQWFQSQRCLGDRQLADGRLGREVVSGDIVSELVYSNHDRMLEMVLSSAKVTPFTALAIVNTITFTASDNSINDSGSGLATVLTGDYIYVTGSTDANNTGLFKVTTGGVAGKIVCAGSAITDKTESAATITIREVDITNGTTELFNTFHKRLVDSTGTVSEQDVLGGVVTQAALSIPANGIATMTWSIMGKQYDTSATTATLSNLTEYDPFDGLSGSYAIDGTASTTMTAFSMTIANGHTPTEALGSTRMTEAIPRKFNVSGSFSVYHTGVTEIDKLLNETESALTVTMSDPAGNQHVVLLPRVKYTSAGVTKSDDGPNMEQINFTALMDQDVTDKTIGWVMIAA